MDRSICISKEISYPMLNVALLDDVFGYWFTEQFIFDLVKKRLEGQLYVVFKNLPGSRPRYVFFLYFTICALVSCILLLPSAIFSSF